MMDTKSPGTGVESLKLLANFFNSVNLTTLSCSRLLLRTFRAVSRCWLANDLNEFKTSRSTVDVALGVPSLTCGDRFRLVEPELCAEVLVFWIVLSSGVLDTDGVVVSAVLSWLVAGCAGLGASVDEATPFLLFSAGRS
jgi:hypothetical protein